MLNESKFYFLKKFFLPRLRFKKIKFNSNNKFSLKINNKFKISDMVISSLKYKLQEAQIFKMILI